MQKHAWSSRLSFSWVVCLDHLFDLVYFVIWLIWFIWISFVQPKNQTDQTNQATAFLRWRISPASCCDVTVLTRTFHQYLLRRPILSPDEAFLVRPPRRTASTPPLASLARSPRGLQSRTSPTAFMNNTG